MASVAAIGMFDGVHLGHKAILDALAAQAQRSGHTPLALTFGRHPLATLSGNGPRLISSLPQKLELISQYATPVVLDFSKADFALTASQFLEKIHNLYGVEAIVMGYSNHIGSDRRDAGWIKTNTSFGVTLVEAIASGNSTPASSLIRAEIEAGDIQSAITLLGHSFTIRGTVVRGNQIGRTIGFPTANISPLEPSQLLPPDGAYAVDIHIDGTTMRGMANTGHRPTLNDGRDKTLEVNIFDFDSDIYGHTIDISVLRRLRPETAFSSLDALKTQLHLDRQNAKSI